MTSSASAALSPDGVGQAGSGTWFCTLFDSGFLTRGVTMARSLQRQGCTIPLVVYCMDDAAHRQLTALAVDNIIAVSLAEFETPELLEVKPGRTRQEYCWTCTPFVITDCMQRFPAQRVIYLDADLYFFADPVVLVDEWLHSGRSVLLTEHRYSPQYDRSLESGRYCVQFQGFDGSEQGIEALRWWKERCHEWCFARVEEGRFGDQKYIDEFPDRFPDLHVLDHLGGGVAPWNVQQYEMGTGPSIDGQPVIFYHFHLFRWMTGDRFVPAGHCYKLDRRQLELLYRPYAAELTRTWQWVEARRPEAVPGRSGAEQLFPRLLAETVARLKGTYCAFEL